MSTLRQLKNSAVKWNAWDLCASPPSPRACDPLPWSVCTNKNGIVTFLCHLCKEEHVLEWPVSHGAQIYTWIFATIQYLVLDTVLMLS